MAYDDRLKAAVDLVAARRHGTDAFWDAVHEAEERYGIPWPEIQAECSRRSALARGKRKRKAEAERASVPSRQGPIIRQGNLFDYDSVGAIRR